MSERVRIITVQLDNDYKADDVEHIMDAIRMIRGVSQVIGHQVVLNDIHQRMIGAGEARMAMFKAIGIITGAAGNDEEKEHRRKLFEFLGIK